MPVGKLIEDTLEIGSFQLPGGQVFERTPAVAVVLVPVEALLPDALGFFDRDQVLVQLAESGFGLLRIEAFAYGSTVLFGQTLSFAVSIGIYCFILALPTRIFAEIDLTGIPAIGSLFGSCHKIQLLPITLRRAVWYTEIVRIPR